MPEDLIQTPGTDLLEVPSIASRRNQRSFYRTTGNLSTTSIESEALFDLRLVTLAPWIAFSVREGANHARNREQPGVRPRRESRIGPNPFGTYRPGSTPRAGSVQQHDREQSHMSLPKSARRTYGHAHPHHSSGEDTGRVAEEVDDRTPLIPSANRDGPSDASNGYGGVFGVSRLSSRPRRGSSSTVSTYKQRHGPSRQHSFPPGDQDYDVNNPPSVPGSPRLGNESRDYHDVMMTGGEFPTKQSPGNRRRHSGLLGDALIDIEGASKAPSEPAGGSAPPSPREPQRRRTIGFPASDDVCIPIESMSEVADEDPTSQTPDGRYTGESRRRRRRKWPDLAVLEEWSLEEKEERSGGSRAKKINEPLLVEGRLRPSKMGPWHKVEEESPYRYTYFNEEFQSTIHAQSLSELVQPGGSFKELFVPDPPEITDTSSDEDGDHTGVRDEQCDGALSPYSHNPLSRVGSRLASINGGLEPESSNTADHASGQATPRKSRPATPKPKRYGPRPTFWLDVLCPTDEEMRVLCQAFGIHALTAEDVMTQEAREKVELFRNYYFLNYRTFEQDQNSEDYLEPVNMYVVVFREGVITFHFSQSPHPPNVRRRIRQLTDYLILSSDWISYAIIDDITDVFQPLIQSIEGEVDGIDETVLRLFQDAVELESTTNSTNEKQSLSGKEESSGRDLLWRVGECRKKVMLLYRLLGNKADVIKGFAKRCNQQWDVAPKSEIGLYLGDIQDHILTMTSNLNHYETLLSRAHSNYLAQITIKMNERQEQSADVLGKLTVLGTIVLPMNIVTGLWGMNVRVPGQDVDNLWWFWGSKSFSQHS